MDVTHNLRKITTGVLVSGGVAVASLGLATGTPHAGAYRWCPGDPPPFASLPDGRGGRGNGPVDPAWDTTVCHDWIPSSDHVREGIPCYSFVCPPGTMREDQMPIVPNVGQG